MLFYCYFLYLKYFTVYYSAPQLYPEKGRFENKPFLHSCIHSFIHTFRRKASSSFLKCSLYTGILKHGYIKDIHICINANVFLSILSDTSHLQVILTSLYVLCYAPCPENIIINKILSM